MINVFYYKYRLYSIFKLCFLFLFLKVCNLYRMYVYIRFWSEKLRNFKYYVYLKNIYKKYIFWMIIF